MKKLIAVTGVILIAYVIFSAAVGTARPILPDRSAALAESSVYVMREEEGRVVVYLNGAIFLRTATPVANLPKNDRLKLQKGITVYSEEELKRLVEDYCS